MLQSMHTGKYNLIELPACPERVRHMSCTLYILYKVIIWGHQPN